MLETLEPQVADRSAWEHVLSLGLPTKEWEVFRYVRLNDLYAQTFEAPCASSVAFNPKEGQLVFVNGRYAEELSRPSAGLVALPLAQAKKQYAHFLHHRLTSQLKAEKDPFAALNQALCDSGLFLYAPPKTVAQVEIVHLFTEQPKPAIATPRIHLFAGKEAELKCFLSYQGRDWVNSYLDAAIDERAAVSLTMLLDEAEGSWHFDAIRATLKRASRFTSYAVSRGKGLSRQDYSIHLLEEEAEASLYGVSRLDERSHAHVNVLMEHQAPNCRSLQHFKNVLKGLSRSSFEGKIYVRQAAQKTEAFQMNNNLILNERASANSKPNLEIFADDVKASHGSTVGQIDTEQLFYLKTRGIPHQKAKELLVEGFCGEILDKIEGAYADMCRLP